MLFCLGGCVTVDCSSDSIGPIPGEDGSVSASANVFVLDPGELPSMNFDWMNINKY